MIYQEAYTLPEDGLVSREVLRNRSYFIRISPICEINTSPFHERFCSERARTFRAPNLSEQQWASEEDYYSEHITTGECIEIYHHNHGTDLKTVYIIQRINLPHQTWKRIIITHHINEDPIVYM